MKYRVIIQPRAEADASEIYHRIHQVAPLNADRWFDALWTTIASLEDMPRRCSKAKESSKFKRDIRQIMHGVYRILFEIEDDEVHIVHIRHGARRYMEPDES